MLGRVPAYAVMTCEVYVQLNYFRQPTSNAANYGLTETFPFPGLSLLSAVKHHIAFPNIIFTDSKERESKREQER